MQPPSPQVAPTDPAAGARLRLAEPLAALSLATDLGMGQPMEWVLLSTVLAVRLASTFALDDADLAAVYYVALLRFVGCTADAHVAAETFGDELSARAHFAQADFGQPTSVIMTLARHLGAGQPPASRARTLLHALANMPRLYGTAVAHCEVGQLLADRLGFERGVHDALFQIFERWDGKGMPRRLRGEAIALPARLVPLANDAVVFHRLGGVAAAREVVKRRAGGAYDPRLAARFVERAEELMADFGHLTVWEAALASEPGTPRTISEAGLDTALEAMADFVDLKSTSTLGHSRGVATLAEAAAHRCRLGPAEAVRLRRAALVHDLGRSGVSAGVWERRGALGDADWERVRLHPYFTERVLARSPALAPLGQLAGLHHERLDGSGYHRAATATQLSVAARLLAAADVYHALVEPRPHRMARTPEQAAQQLRDDAFAGRLDPTAADAVLIAAGHHNRRRTTGTSYPAGLTEREVEVLRLVARGLADKHIAEQLVISERTAHHHVEHIFDKLCVSTRAAAAFFAMQHDLLERAPPEMG
jgi:HD-GYP domain-containing protein (c-di-GMP phosphodiesterase class II)